MAHPILEFYRKTNILKDFPFGKTVEIPHLLLPVYLSLQDTPLYFITLNPYPFFISLKNLLKENVELVMPYNEERIEAGIPQDIDIVRSHIDLLSDKKRFYVIHFDLLNQYVPNKISGFNPKQIKIGDTIDKKEFTEELVNMGYSRCDFIYEEGEFASRGMVIDIFLSNNPVRILFDDDIVESISVIDVSSQKSIKKIDTILVPVINDIYENGINKEKTFYDVLKDKIVLSYEVSDEFEEYLCKIKNITNPLVKQWNLPKFTDKAIEMIRGENPPNLHILVSSYAYVSIWEDILERNGIKGNVCEGIIQSGYIDYMYGISVINDFEIYKRDIPSMPKKKSVKRFVFKGDEFEEGEIVVHEDYGIGRYIGIKKEKDISKVFDVIVIEYDDGILKLPVLYADKIYKYNYPDLDDVPLDKLKSTAWKKRRKKIEEDVKSVMYELSRLYAERHLIKGIAFDKDTVGQLEMEADFPYEETEDQLKAIEEIKKDMESPHPMDRVLCGEVGYGKTEVAIRASFKAVMSGYQVAILCPTTILSEQHYRTFKHRLRNFHYIRIEQLSRLVSKKKEKEIIDSINKGDIDIVIGTHKLLSDRIKFSNLGLLIIDEEHKFGVKHKEKIRMLRKNVDTLLMSATPIPRTIEMALSGIRDISFIQTPPIGRKSVYTEIISRDNKKKIKEIILSEIQREGQVYIVTDKIRTIPKIKSDIEDMLPNTVKIGVAHGQMPPAKLEKETIRFFQGIYDILISTDIVGSGIDNPRSNTILIYNAHNFGLSQLHQLRGRVGRSHIQSYAYLIVPSMKTISQKARDRLTAIVQYQDLGSGLNIALKDLEMRGSGDLLGVKQHGKISGIGYSMYWKIIEKVSEEIKGEKKFLTDDIEIDTSYDISIPYDYISNSSKRLKIYRTLASATTAMDIELLKEELEDLMGYVPPSMEHLFNISYLKMLGRRLPIIKMFIGKKEFVVEFSENININCFKKFFLENPHIDFSFKGVKNTIIKISSPSLKFEDMETFLKKVLECDKLNK